MTQRGFEWSSALSIGVPKMDRDHQKIIDYMNRLALAAERNADFGEQKAAFTRLKDFTRQHFEEEEVFMESIDFDRVATHKLIHKKLLGELDDHFSRFVASGTLDDRLFHFLTFWLKSHICGIDKQYGRLVAPGG